MASISVNFFLIVSVLIVRQVLNMLHIFMFMSRMWTILMYVRSVFVIVTLLAEALLLLLLTVDSVSVESLTDGVATLELITAVSFIGFDYAGD